MSARLIHRAAAGGSGSRVTAPSPWGGTVTQLADYPTPPAENTSLPGVAVSCERRVGDADLPVEPPVELGSTQAYALCTVRKYAMMAIHAGCSEDQVYSIVRRRDQPGRFEERGVDDSER